MSETHPSVVVLAGPNGAGKTTASLDLLANTFHVAEFVNADVIARGLSGFDPDRAALAAGRIMLTRLRELAAERQSFAFETTLASRTFVPWIRELLGGGYEFHLVYFWLPNAEAAIARVSARVARGGHHVPDDVVRRRYARSVHNFFNLYQPIATSWRVYNNGAEGGPALVALGAGTAVHRLVDPSAWGAIQESMTHGNQD